MRKLALFLIVLCVMVANAADVKTTDVTKIDNTIYGIDAKVGIDGTAVMSVCMKNNIEVPGFQFDIVVPEGFSVPTDEDGYYLIELSTARTSLKNTNVFESAKQSDGSIRVLAASTKLATFKGNDGEVCTIVFQTDGDVKPGTYTVTLKNIVISDTTGQISISPDPTSANILVDENVGVELIETGTPVDAEIFGADGIRRSELQQGVNIIRYTNGYTKKVLVK